MKKYTLLEMVQKILDSMVSDSVNSIDDTEESLIVTGIIEDTYHEIMSREDWPFLRKVRTLDSVSDINRPNLLKSPVPVSNLRDVRYNVRKSTDVRDFYVEMDYLTPDQFLDMVYQRPSNDSAIKVVTLDTGVKLPIYNNRAPRFYTSFDDETLVFDAFDSGVDSTLQSSKSVATVVERPEWENTDSFVPDIPLNMFQLLLSEAKSACHLYLKQQVSPIDAKRSFRQGSMARWNSQKVKDKSSSRRGFGRR